MEATVTWKVQDIINPTNELMSLLVLNNEGQNENLTWMKHLCPKASQIVCVDGGLNFYEKYMEMMTQQALASNNVQRAAIQIPHQIIGDFDSVDMKLLNIYRQRGSTIVETPDQNETDFTKAIKMISSLGHQTSYICTLAKLDSSRVDHFFGIIQSLYKGADYHDKPIVVLSGTSIYWLLQKGSHRIEIPKDILTCGNSWCGLIPLNPSTVSTTGLKWNLENHELAFGKLVSSSNTYSETSDGIVTIQTSSPLLWTMGLNPQYPSPCCP